MPAANLNTIRQTIEARLSDELDDSPAIDIAFGNVSFFQLLTPLGFSAWLLTGKTNISAMAALATAKT